MGDTRPVLALDVGGTKLAAGVVGPDGLIVSFQQVPTWVDEGPVRTVERLLQLGDDVLQAAGTDPADLAATGVGCGGPLDPATGVILGPPGLPGWDGVPLGRQVRDRFGSAYVENDASAAALAEYRWAGWGVRRLVYLTVSTGFGGGVVRDGVLFRGAAGQGGEFGHVVIDWHGRRCGCGARGCAVAYVSGTSIAKRAAEAVRADPTSALASLDPITAQDVFEHAQNADRTAVRVWDETTAMLGRAVAVLINVLEPDLVVLGGGVTRAGDLLLGPVREQALAQAMAPAAEVCDVALTRHGDRVGVLGAAAIAYDRLGRG
jgi:glucokinase